MRKHAGGVTGAGLGALLVLVAGCADKGGRYTFIGLGELPPGTPFFVNGQPAGNLDHRGGIEVSLLAGVYAADEKTELVAKIDTPCGPKELRAVLSDSTTVEEEKSGRNPGVARTMSLRLESPLDTVKVWVDSYGASGSRLTIGAMEIPSDEQHVTLHWSHCTAAQDVRVDGNKIGEFPRQLAPGNQLVIALRPGCYLQQPVVYSELGGVGADEGDVTFKGKQVFEVKPLGYFLRFPPEKIEGYKETVRKTWSLNRVSCGSAKR